MEIFGVEDPVISQQNASLLVIFLKHNILLNYTWHLWSFSSPTFFFFKQLILSFITPPESVSEDITLLLLIFSFKF